MKRNVIVSTVAAAIVSAMMVTACGTTGSGAVVEKAAAEGSQAASEAADAVASSVEAAEEAVSSAAEDIQASTDEDTFGDEFEMLKEKLTYMGGLYISDPQNDLMMSIFRQDGEPYVIIEKLGHIYYGALITEDGKLDDGREYTKILIEDKEFGYHFKLEDEDADSFLVDEDGTVYPAKDVDESVALDMVKKTL